MDDQQTKIFNDWFYELESYGHRSERFYQDANIPDQFRRDVILVTWLQEAFMLGVQAGKEQ